MKLPNAVGLIETLRSHKAETEWFEFKKDHFDPISLGEYVSALANSAMLEDKSEAFIVFGIEDGSKDIVGTKVRLKTEKVKGEIFEAWLSRFLSPRISIIFDNCFIDGKRLEIICIKPAFERPVRFCNIAYIRVNSIKKRLDEYPEKERTLWNLTSRYSFEEGIAANHLSRIAIFERFHCRRFGKLLYSEALSDDIVFDNLIKDRFIIDNLQGGFDVTNLFALSAARNLHEFKTISGKAPRVIVYKGNTKRVGMEDSTGQTGYAIAFPILLKYIMDNVLSSEIMVHGKRIKQHFYPEVAVREFLANALIHQDLVLQGARPTIEIFNDKIQITNPGSPLVSPERFIDAPARSRNEKLAGLMRKAGFCEERGSGIDRALWAIEESLLAPPLFQEVEGSTIVTLFRNTDFSAMSKEDRIRACYQHASLRFLQGQPMGNQSLRVRLGLNKNQYQQATNVINDALEDGKIRPLDPDQGNSVARYVPFWA